MSGLFSHEMFYFFLLFYSCLVLVATSEPFSTSEHINMSIGICGKMLHDISFISIHWRLQKCRHSSDTVFLAAGLSNNLQGDDMIDNRHRLTLRLRRDEWTGRRSRWAISSCPRPISNCPQRRHRSKVSFLGV